MTRLSRKLSFLSIIWVFLSCNPKTSEQNPNPSNEDTTAIKHSSSVIKQDTSRNASRAISHQLLFELFPKTIQGYKTVGYPDENDNFTGLPTGETESNFTSPQYLSFAKHLYESKSGNLLAIEVIDYNPNKESLEGLFKMYLGGTGIEDKVIKISKYDLGIENTKTLIRDFFTQNKVEMHIFLCNRFLINLQITDKNGNNLNELKKACSLLNISTMADNYCQ